MSVVSTQHSMVLGNPITLSLSYIKTLLFMCPTYDLKTNGLKQHGTVAQLDAC